MVELDPVVEIKSDHAMVRDALLDLIEAIEKKDATTALEILLKLDKLTGPHFRWEEESFYLAHEKFYGRKYLEYLLGVHDRIVRRGKELAEILGTGKITDEQAKALPDILRFDILSHPIECEGITLFTEKLPKEEIDKMAVEFERCRAEDIPLLEWGDTIKDKYRAEKGLIAASV
jgi:hypothetical protein